MNIKFMWKDTQSGGGGCPAIYEAPGGYVVQGVKLDAETRAQLRQLADNEDGVWVPANVLDRLRDMA
ncbi:lipid A biosynthesis lauroyl acyltransferase [Planobispora rosea]|uniref:lipid A biosynthesis lauroyl acyltransferase n=1 Tax=Planobispora rosea TaxID=35762 RepID=UPI00083AD84D|nr:lipid A biosynthesis lauroyl acyltransferase [Planobispora rosea]